jgi:uncharacterized DUF497 family protein
VRDVSKASGRKLLSVEHKGTGEKRQQGLLTRQLSRNSASGGVGLSGRYGEVERGQCLLSNLFNANTINTYMQFTFDPRKDGANIAKHGLSLSDAPLVFNAINKLTIESPRGDENRLMDVAMVEVASVVLVLVYVLREPNEVRAISLRRASKQERTLYAQNSH